MYVLVVPFEIENCHQSFLLKLDPNQNKLSFGTKEDINVCNQNQTAIVVETNLLTEHDSEPSY